MELANKYELRIVNAGRAFVIFTEKPWRNIQSYSLDFASVITLINSDMTAHGFQFFVGQDYFKEDADSFDRVLLPRKVDFLLNYAGVNLHD
jgi:hypothetical protein